MIGMEAASSVPVEQRAQAMVDAVGHLTEQLHRLAGLHLRLSDLGVMEKDLERVADTALNDGALIVNPAALDRERVLDLLHRAY